MQGKLKPVSIAGLCVVTHIAGRNDADRRLRRIAAHAPTGACAAVGYKHARQSYTRAT